MDAPAHQVPQEAKGRLKPHQVQCRNLQLTVHKLLLDSPETLTSLLLISLFLISVLMQLYSLGDWLWWGHPVCLWQQLREGPALSQEMCPSK